MNDYVKISMYLKQDTIKLYKAVTILFKGKKKAYEITDEAMISYLNTIIKENKLESKVQALLQVL